MSVNVFGAAGSVLTPLELVGALGDFVRSARADSLVEYTADTRIEPICLIDTSLLGLPFMEGALQAQLTMFSGLYLSAVQVGASSVDGVSIVNRLGRFNPNRDPINTAVDSVSSLVNVISTEQMKFGLPPIATLQNHVSMEADEIPSHVSAQTIGKDTLKLMKENDNMGVGKTLEVTIRIDDKTFTVPVIVRLNTVPTPGSVIASELCSLAENLKPDPRDRKIKLKAGAIRWLEDFVACSDIVDNHMNTIIKDPSGMYMASIERARKNKLAGWLSGRPSVATASTIYNISEETEMEIERRLGIDISNPNHRRRLFEKSAMMVLYVFNREFEQVTTYYRGCKDFQRISFKAIESKGNSDRTSDVLRLMQDFSQMKAPSF